MWVGVRYDRGVVVATPHGILTKKMLVPPLWLADGVVGPNRGGGGRGGII